MRFDLGLSTAALSAVLLFSASLTAGQPQLVQAGPMIGHVSDSTATVWLRVKRGADVEGRAEQTGRGFSPREIEDLGNGFLLVHFEGLKGETETDVRLTVRRGDQEPEEETVSFKTAPAPASTGKVRLAFGSCSKLPQFGEGPVYEAIADERPDFAIFGGDNVYFMVADGSKRHFATGGKKGDWNFYESMMARHLETRVHPDLQRMLRTVPSYAVWDDHDYGPNNSDSTFELKEEATRAFRQVWANPSYGTGDIPGIFSSFRHGPVEVFLMDNRTHKRSPLRHDDVTRETGRIWGEAQLEWLMEGLRASTAPVKLIANGTQVLSLEERGEGHFQEAQGEQRRLLDFLAEEKIGGVVFLTGDRHHSEAMQQEQPGGALVLDLTSSPMAWGQKIRPYERTHENQVWAMWGDSYGLVTIDIPEEGEGTIRFEARDDENAVPEVAGEKPVTIWELQQLQY